MNEAELKDMIAKLSQFPHKQRKENYQSYYIRNEKIEGSRDTEQRMKLMKMPMVMYGMSVLDLGCNLGEIANETSRRFASKIMGIDYEQDYINCAIELAKYNNYNITYVQKDLTDIESTSNLINEFFNNKSIDIVFALSLYKHIKGDLFKLLDKIKFKKCIIESNNAPDGINTGHVKEMILYITDRKWKWKHIGTDNTRSPRMIFEVTK